MKTSHTVILLLFSSYLSCFAITPPIPDIPVPSLTITKAIAIAQEQVKGNPTCVLVGVQWCLPASFQPPVHDGSQYSADDDADSYSWFVTFVYNNEHTRKSYEDAGSKRKDAKYNTVLVIRVKKDGSAGALSSVRF